MPTEDVTLDEPTFAGLIADLDRLYELRERLSARQRKKLDERLAVQRVYALRAHIDVIWHERPDFLLRTHRGSKPFGVEVRRLFDSGSSARLEEAVGYSEHLLSGGAVWHKDDVGGLSVAKIRIEDADGRAIAKDEPAIIRSMPTRAKWLASVRDAMLKKESLFPPQCDVSHINLILDERTSSLATVESCDFYPHFFTSELRQTVFHSPFREIFLITRLKSGRVSIPLRMLLTTAQLFFFDAALASIELKLETTAEYMTLFTAYLRSLTSRQIGLRGGDAGTEVLHGDVGLLVSQDGDGLHPAVRMYMDESWPDCYTIDEALPQLPKDLTVALDAVQVKSTFTSGIAFPAWGT
jgi:hypothetical protein